MDQSMRLLVNGGYTQLHQSGYMSVSGRYVLILCVFFVCVRWRGQGEVICLCLLVFEHALCLRKFMLLYRWVAIEYLGEPGNSFRRFLQNSAVNLGEVTLHNGGS